MYRNQPWVTDDGTDLLPLKKIGPGVEYDHIKSLYHTVHVYVVIRLCDIVCLISINLQKKILKNPDFYTLVNIINIERPNG